jgi:hypothetical protein
VAKTAEEEITLLAAAELDFQQDDEEEQKSEAKLA